MALRLVTNFVRSSVHRNVPAALHTAALKMQPTKIPVSDEEKKLLEKLGEPDNETRGYLNELYADFDVTAEKKREQRQQKKDKEEDEKQSPPSAKSCPVSQGGMMRMLHTSSRFSCKETTDLPLSFKVGKKVVTDDSQIIWDSQEQADYYPDKNQSVPVKGVAVPHGEQGVFDIEDLIPLLEQERLQDIVVMATPPQLVYADFIVVGTTMSPRHGRAICAFLKKLYKQTKTAKDYQLKIEGISCDEWRLMDMGNIVLHLFDTETRQKYDLETLWTVGHEFDEKTTSDVTNRTETADMLTQQMEFVRSLSVRKAEA